MTTRTLTDTLASELPPSARVGFRNVDCEGEGVAALCGLDPARRVPLMAATEAREEATATDLTGVLSRAGHDPVNHMAVETIFRLGVRDLREAACASS